MDQRADLALEGFGEVPRANWPVGIIALLWRGEVVYVGRAKSVYQRVAQQWQRMQFPQMDTMRITDRPTWKEPKRFDEVWVRWCSESELVRLEVKYREKFKPELNEAIPAAPKTSIAELAERAKVIL